MVFSQNQEGPCRAALSQQTVTKHLCALFMPLTNRFVSTACIACGACNWWHEVPGATFVLLHQLRCVLLCACPVQLGLVRLLSSRLSET